jgi:hypothetical protein
MKGGGAAGRELPSGYVAGTNRYMTGEPEESLPSRGSGEEQLAAWADGIRISRLDHIRDPDGNLIEISSYETGASSGGGPSVTG